MSERYDQWVLARQAAIEKANRLGLDVAIRYVKEFGRRGYNVAVASKMDSDYVRAEIVRPGAFI